MPELNTCSNCYFSLGNNDGIECRIDAPIVSLAYQDNSWKQKTAWPAIDENDWCGQYKPNQPDQPNQSQPVEFSKDLGILNAATDDQKTELSQA